MNDPVLQMTGIILAGGKSSRMGADKSLLVLNGRPVISHMHSLLSNVFSRMLVITNKPEQFRFLGVPCATDIFEDAGPLGGIHAGLVHSGSERNFIIACDLLLMSQEMIHHLATIETHHPITLAGSDGAIHYLCGVYKRQCLNEAEALLRNRADAMRGGEPQRPDAVSMHALCMRTGVEVIDPTTLPFAAPDLFFNMNRPEDFQYVARRLDGVTY